MSLWNYADSIEKEERVILSLSGKMLSLQYIFFCPLSPAAPTSGRNPAAVRNPTAQTATPGGR